MDIAKIIDLMISKYTDPVLSEPLYKLEVSPDFQAVCELAGFHTLAEIVKHHTGSLLQLPGFSYHLLGELVAFLEKRNMGHYIDPFN
jgi:hypothetical protein